MYSLPMEVVLRNLCTGNMMKLPDPRDFIIGLNYVRPKKISVSTGSRKQGKSIWLIAGVSKIKKKQNEIKKDILMKTSTLFKAEKLKRKHRMSIFNQKFSLFVSNKKKKHELFSKRKSSQLKKMKTRKKEKPKTGSAKKENVFFSKKRTSREWGTSKRRSLVNISRAYSKYKHSFLDHDKQTNPKKNISIKKHIQGKRNRRATLKQLKQSRDTEDTHAGRSRFIEINKCGTDKTNS